MTTRACLPPCTHLQANAGAVARLRRLIALCSILASSFVGSSGVAQTSSAPPTSLGLPRVSAEASVQALRERLGEILSGSAGGGVTAAVLAVSLDRGDTLFSRNADVPLVPASNMKLYSTAAALYYLGDSFRYTTSLYATSPIQNGEILGDLILFGTGDPTVSGRMLDDPLVVYRVFADSLASLGVRRIAGDIVGDGSYFDDEWTGPGWLDSDLDDSYGAPVGALAFAENVVTLRVQPGVVGGAARVTTVPATTGLAVENRVRTVLSGSSSVSLQRSEAGLILSGQIRRGASAITRTTPVVDPANYAAAALRAALEARGIVVVGGVRSVHTEAESSISGNRVDTGTRLLAVHFSAPLAEIVSVTNHVSQNMFAEVLLKTVGKAVGGEGSYSAGAEAVSRILEDEVGADTRGLSLIDGSGLSRTNRLTARTTVHLLDYMAESREGATFMASLPQAATADGLRRMTGTAAARNLRAKTGTVRNVSALSGYVRSGNGERLAFSIIFNGVPSTAAAKDVENRIGAALAAFNRNSPR